MPNLLAGTFPAAQPPLMAAKPSELHAAINSLALGGAEFIVLDWARRLRPPWTAHLIVLRDGAHEFSVPSSVHVTRLHGVDILPQLSTMGQSIARSAVPTCLSHLLTAPERRAIASSGAFVVPVVHNAEPGWLEPLDALAGADHVVTVSDASARELGRSVNPTATSVVRHLPRRRQFPAGVRDHWRAAWRIPRDAMVIGMIGGVKPQKNYPLAVEVLRGVLERRDAYLAIVGGPIGREGRAAWHAVLDEMRRSGVRERMAMPGFVEDAAACLPAFDVFLNTSDYEGLSIATLDARVNGVPVVASRVGGQGELGDEGLTLVDRHAPVDVWADALLGALDSKPGPPRWHGCPSHRLWTLAHLARPCGAAGRVLFVTANLNAGGAQRSLVNVATALRRTHPTIDFEVAVSGDSTADYFLEMLRSAGVTVWRTAATRDPFDHAEALVHHICAEHFGAVCFWNVDPKIKLLVTKPLAFTTLAIVDVSPGPASFDEMSAVEPFGRLIAFSEDRFYSRLDRLVTKYDGAVPAQCRAKTVVIPNGVAAHPRVKTQFATAQRGGRVVVNGRMAPTKFLVEIVEAMALVRRRRPDAELHVFGAAEPRHADYADRVRRAAGTALDRRVFFHGADGRAFDALPDFDVFVVLGEQQGSPNALLEALAAGLPCIANDDGGTRDQIVHERTGLLVPDRSPAALAAAIERLLADRVLAARLGTAGNDHVRSAFTLDAMASRYAQLFASLTDRSRQEKSA